MNCFISKNLPLVTVAIPTFNRCVFLKEALQSALNQDYQRLEILVSDNASTDGTEDFLSKNDDSRLTVIRQSSTLDMISNWNACLKAARGEYILMLSDDDRIMPDAISRLVAAIVGDHIAFSYGRCQFYDQKLGITELTHSAPDIESSLEFQIGVLQGVRISYPSATLLRVSDALSCGGYSLRFPAAIDNGLIFQLANLRPKISFCNEPTTLYTFHQNNFTSHINFSELGITMFSLANVVRAGLGDERLSKAEERTLRQSPSKAISDLVSELHRRKLIGHVVAYRGLISHRSFFIGFSGMLSLFKAFSKILIRSMGL